MATVKELVDQLNSMPQDAQVLITMDQGDNDPSYPVSEVTEGLAMRDEVEAREAYVAFKEDFGGQVPEEYQEVVVLWAE